MNIGAFAAILSSISSLFGGGQQQPPAPISELNTSQNIKPAMSPFPQNGPTLPPTTTVASPVKQNKQESIPVPTTAQTPAPTPSQPSGSKLSNTLGNPAVVAAIAALAGKKQLPVLPQPASLPRSSFNPVDANPFLILEAIRNARRRG